MKRSGGFTMVEVLVAIAILAILFSLSLPGFSRWLPNYRLRGAARDVFSDMQLAKMTAIKERGECAVLFDTANSCYKIISGGPDGKYSTTGDNVQLKEIKFSEYGSGVAYGNGSATSPVPDGGAFDGDGVTFTGNAVVFNQRGVINSAAGGYTYLQNSRNNTFAVGAWGSGAIVLRRWTGSAWQ